MLNRRTETFSTSTTIEAGAATQSNPRKLFGYNVISFLGEGAASRIYSVSSPSTGQIYALKHVIRKEDKDIRFIEQLENEYRIGKQVSHPGLRAFIELKTTRNLLLKITEAALVMELLKGTPLDENLPTSTAEIIRCFIETAQALQALHKAGFVHCDLKPGNILLDPTGTARVIDLGQACPIGTIKKRIQGTPDYISPEQVKLQPVSVQTDVFNLGATLYWTLCGRKMPTLYTMNLKSDLGTRPDMTLRSPRDHNPLVPEPLSNFVMECVRQTPEKRPKDMREVIERLEIIRHMSLRGNSNGGQGPRVG